MNLCFILRNYKNNILNTFIFLKWFFFWLLRVIFIIYFNEEKLYKLTLPILNCSKCFCDYCHK